jgi:hypothetical protein
MHLLCDCLHLMLKPLVLLKKNCKFCSVEVMDIDPLSLNKFQLIHTCTFHAKSWAIYSLLDLEVTSKSCKYSQNSSNFHEFWSEEPHCEKWSKWLIWSSAWIANWVLKTLIFDHYNPVDPTEWGAVTFLGWFPTR